MSTKKQRIKANLKKRIKKLAMAGLDRTASDLITMGRIVAEGIAEKLVERKLLVAAKPYKVDKFGQYLKGTGSLGVWYRFLKSTDGKALPKGEILKVIKELAPEYRKSRTNKDAIEVSNIGASKANAWWMDIGGGEVVCGTYVKLSNVDMEDLIDDWAMQHLK